MSAVGLARWRQHPDRSTRPHSVPPTLPDCGFRRWWHSRYSTSIPSACCCGSSRAKAEGSLCDALAGAARTVTRLVSHCAAGSVVVPGPDPGRASAPRLAVPHMLPSRIRPVYAGLAKSIGSIRPITHQSASSYKLAPKIRRGQPVASRQRNKLIAPIIEERIGSD
jgi:hypothetical protein